MPVRVHRHLPSHLHTAPPRTAGPIAGFALLARRPFPWLGPAVARVVISVAAVWGGYAFWNSTSMQVAAALAAWRLARDNPIRQAIAGLAVTTAGQATFLLLAPASANINPVAVCFVTAACLGAGGIVRHRAGVAADLALGAAEVARNREGLARDAGAAERSRIARELHDVVAHTVTVMTVQAGGARMLLDADTARAETAVRAVESAGHEALEELRGMVDFLDGDDGLRLDPQPGMASLERLVQQIREAGLDLDVVVDGNCPALGSGLDLTAYRVVQEGLTNALRYGSGTARLHVSYSADLVSIDIVNQAGLLPGRSSGSGLIGIRERVALYDGSIDTGIREDGRFVLHARLPVGVGRLS